MSHLGPAKNPFDIMSIDTIGGFGGSRLTKKYLHLLVDHFTRNAYILTFKTQGADDFIKLINNLAEKNKISLVLVDQYPGINSGKFWQFLKAKNIPPIFTAVDSPYSSSLSEMLNETFVNKNRFKINERNKKVAWTTKAQECTKMYNQTWHTTTGFAPKYLMKGTSTIVIPDGLKKTIRMPTG